MCNFCPVYMRWANEKLVRSGSGHRYTYLRSHSGHESCPGSRAISHSAANRMAPRCRLAFLFLSRHGCLHCSLIYKSRVQNTRDDRLLFIHATSRRWTGGWGKGPHVHTLGSRSIGPLCHFSCCFARRGHFIPSSARGISLEAESHPIFKINSDE